MLHYLLVVFLGFLVGVVVALVVGTIARGGRG